MHAIEKILARAAGKKAIAAGEIVNCRVDLAGINDLYLQTVRSFYEMGGRRVHDPGPTRRVLRPLCPGVDHPSGGKPQAIQSFCTEQGIGLLMEINQGVCHQVLADRGLSRPGEILVVTDSHTTTHGAFGAFGTGVGATDMAVIMLTGKLWFRVPEILRIHLEGSLPGGLRQGHHPACHRQARGRLRGLPGGGIHRSGAGSLSISERMALCNMTTEMGAKTSYIQPDEVTFNFLGEKGAEGFEVFTTDPGFRYAADHTFDVSALAPQVAAPNSVDNVVRPGNPGRPADRPGLPGHLYRREGRRHRGCGANPGGAQDGASPDALSGRPGLQRCPSGGDGPGLRPDSGAGGGHLGHSRLRCLPRDPPGDADRRRDLHHLGQPELSRPHGAYPGRNFSRFPGGRGCGRCRR